ncbi:MAG: alpha/beta hydrolase [Litorimonas sp.]
MNEPLLLLPGMMCDEHLFSPQIAAFSASRVVMVAPLTGHDSFTDMANQILETAPAKFALAGLSMGGIAAMEIMRLAPHRVTRLALMDTNHLPDTPERRAGRDVQIAKARSGGLYDIMRDEMKPNYLADSPNRADILKLCMEMAHALGPDVFINQSKALQIRRDQTETLKQINVPTLIFCGREDTLCPVERHELMQSLIVASEMAVIEGAGHLPVLETPDRTNELLQNWLNRSG